MQVNGSDDCTDLRTSIYISTAFFITKTLIILPLSSLVLYLGLQRWQQQRSFAATSHSDIFTYNVAALELVSGVGRLLFTCGLFTGLSVLQDVGQFVSDISYPGQMLFHVLTCVERYLAVVHPVTYMGLRQSGGARIRNISITCAWLLSFGWSGVMVSTLPPYVQYFCLLIVAIVVVSFCSLRVLCVLIRPGPGEVGGARERVDQSKRRALHTIAVITVVLWLWFAGVLVCLSLDTSKLLSYSSGCKVLTSSEWFNLLGSLVLPLLFLHRAGKLCCPKRV